MQKQITHQLTLSTVMQACCHRGKQLSCSRSWARRACGCARTSWRLSCRHWMSSPCSCEHCSSDRGRVLAEYDRQQLQHGIMEGVMQALDALALAPLHTAMLTVAVYYGSRPNRTVLQAVYCCSILFYFLILSRRPFHFNCFLLPLAFLSKQIFHISLFQGSFPQQG